MSDNVKHPSHYADNCSLECIQVMRVIFGQKVVNYFCLCDSFKYVWRWKYKNGKEDLLKASCYLGMVDKDFMDDKQTEIFAELASLILEIERAEKKNGTEIKS